MNGQTSDSKCSLRAWGGNTANSGEVFQIALGLAPFVKLVPWFAVSGDKTLIPGSNLSGATSVTFKGVPSVFTVWSDHALVASVPDGGSGVVQVVTPGGTLTSDRPFVVLPSPPPPSVQ